MNKYSVDEPLRELEMAGGGHVPQPGPCDATNSDTPEGSSALTMSGANVRVNTVEYTPAHIRSRRLSTARLSIWPLFMSSSCGKAPGGRSSIGV